MFTALGLASGIIGIIGLLLKYYPTWRKDKENKDVRKQLDGFEKDLLAGDDLGVSQRLSSELDRVRRKESGGDTTIGQSS